MAFAVCRHIVYSFQNLLDCAVDATALVEKLLDTPDGSEADLQGVAVLLASEASDYMTGSDILIHGGYCCWQQTKGRTAGTTVLRELLMLTKKSR